MLQEREKEVCFLRFTKYAYIHIQLPQEVIIAQLHNFNNNFLAMLECRGSKLCSFMSQWLFHSITRPNSSTHLVVRSQQSNGYLLPVSILFLSKHSYQWDVCTCWALRFFNCTELEFRLNAATHISCSTLIFM